MGDIFSAIQRDTAGFTPEERREVATAQWISVSAEISDAAVAAAEADFAAAEPDADGHREVFAPLTAKLPAHACVLYEESLDGWVMGVTVPEKDPDTVFLLIPTADRMVPIAKYTPGHSTVYITQRGIDLSPTGGDGLRTLVAHVAQTLALINTPTYCTRVPHGTRQVTRRIQRALNTDRLTVSRIVWSIHTPKDIVAPGKATEDRHMPLHYTRGHWRVAEPHFTRAIMHADGVCRQWIEGFWSGHPAYGIKKSVYAPKL